MIMTTVVMTTVDGDDGDNDDLEDEHVGLDTNIAKKCSKFLTRNSYKFPELVVSLAHKRKRDHFQPAENLNYSLCRQGNTKTTRKI